MLHDNATLPIFNTFTKNCLLRHWLVKLNFKGMKIQHSRASLRVSSMKKFKNTLLKSDLLETDFKEELIGEIIKRARERQQITQEDLAEHLGINKSNISKIENNLTSIRMETFFKVMNALKAKVTVKLEFEVTERGIDIGN